MDFCGVTHLTLSKTVREVLSLKRDYRSHYYSYPVLIAVALVENINVISLQGNSGIPF